MKYITLLLLLLTLIVTGCVEKTACDDMPYIGEEIEILQSSLKNAANANGCYPCVLRKFDVLSTDKEAVDIECRCTAGPGTLHMRGPNLCQYFKKADQ